MGGKPRQRRWWQVAPRGAQRTCDAIAQLPGVLGVFWGQPRRHGRWATNKSALCVHTDTKRPLDALAPDERIDGIAGIIPTDVIASGVPRAHYLDHTDVALSSIGRSGTVSVLSKPDELRALLSGHVALPIRDGRIVRRYNVHGGGFQVRFRDPYDEPYVGRVVRGMLGDGSSLDWALAELPAKAKPLINPYHVATRSTGPHRYRRAKLAHGQNLHHYSRLPGRRRIVTGRLRQVAETPIAVRLPDKTKSIYAHLLAVSSNPKVPFSLDGDSGSLVVDDWQEVVGVVLGASDVENIAYVLPVWPLIVSLGPHKSWFFK